VERKFFILFKRVSFRMAAEDHPARHDQSAKETSCPAIPFGFIECGTYITRVASEAE
jgi:hypothetical protein